MAHNGYMALCKFADDNDLVVELHVDGGEPKRIKIGGETILYRELRLLRIKSLNGNEIDGKAVALSAPVNKFRDLDQAAAVLLRRLL